MKLNDPSNSGNPITIVLFLLKFKSENPKLKIRQGCVGRVLDNLTCHPRLGNVQDLQWMELVHCWCCFHGNLPLNHGHVPDRALLDSSFPLQWASETHWCWQTKNMKSNEQSKISWQSTIQEMKQNKPAKEKKIDKFQSKPRDHERWQSTIHCLNSFWEGNMGKGK